MSIDLWPTREDTQKSFRIDSTDPFALQSLQGSLQTLVEPIYHPQLHQLIILCIGTDRSTGDALGPFVGTKLCQLNPHHVFIYGTLDEPVHAVNLAQIIATIHKQHECPFIIALDACLGRIDSVGSIDVGIGPTRPGAGVSKDLPTIGDIYINGIVNVGGFLEYFVLQNTRLNLVVNLAETIARGIYLWLQGLPARS